MRKIIIPTSPAKHLTKGMEKNFKVIFPCLNKNGKRLFPDGEIYMKIKSAGFLKGKSVIVLHSGSPEPNHGLVELELILQILKDSKAKTSVFFAYFPYSMQDKVFEPGETNVAENLIEKLVNYYKVERIYAIDPHFGGRKWVKKYPIKTISAIDILVEKAKNDFGKDIVFLAPDKGGTRRSGLKGAKKKRISPSEVELCLPKQNFKGKTIAIVDDILETGGTLVKFIKEMQKSRPKQILVLATHGIIGQGIEKVKKQCKKLYLTNTVNQNQANVDIEKIISKNLF